MIKQTIFTALITFLGATGIFGFFQFLIQRADKKRDRQQEILDKFDHFVEVQGERWAKSARQNILRFDDELLAGEHHSREYFRSILEEIDNYEEFCRSHSDFKNSYTVEAEGHIRKVYARLLEGGDFKN